MLKQGDIFYACICKSHSTKDVCVLVSKALFHWRSYVCWGYITPRILAALSNEGALTSNGKKKVYQEEGPRHL